MKTQDAKQLKQGQTVYHISKKNRDGSPMRSRVTSIKTWRRTPERIEVRVKHGLYDYATFTEHDINLLTTNELEAAIYPNLPDPSGHNLNG